MEQTDIREIINSYTTGEATLEETNAALEQAGAGIYINPGQNQLTAEEIATTTTGETPEDANGYGLLDTGTGTMEKVYVEDGTLDEPVNEIGDDGEVNMPAFVLIGGKRYAVRADILTEC